MLNRTDSEIVEYRYPDSGMTLFVLKSEDGGCVDSYRTKEEAMLTAAALGLDVEDSVREINIDLFRFVSARRAIGLNPGEKPFPDKT